MNSSTIENVLIKCNEKCGDDNICTIRTSLESHLHSKKHFHRNLLYFRVYADFEADNEITKSSIEIKTKSLGNKYEQNFIGIIYKQNPVLNGYHIISELEDVLKSGYYESPLVYINIEWL